ncbi:MAG: lysophospholipid acyltransferase family protein [Thermoanaerobacteraceae bacterium]|nr:lysophospholipid acyltransferase family protein [Thermoanaerobacteraceae bacterium]
MFYIVFKHICYAIFKILFRLKFEGLENIPDKGACIIASNHRSILDPFLIIAGSKRKIIFLANQYLFDIPVIGALIRKLDALPLNKEKVDIKALRTALKILQDGGIIGIFPEGGVRESGDSNIEEGVLFLASKSKSPIVACTIEDSGEALPPGKYIPKFKRIYIKFFNLIDCKDITKDKYDDYKKLIYKYINNIQEVKDA